jgi:hypothetical protein
VIVDSTINPVAGPNRRDGGRLWHVILGAGVVVWTFLLGCTPLRDFDIWWHLRTGQLILERGAVPMTDWYTYTNPTQPWIDLHWGFQVAAALLYRIGGVNALLLGKAAVGAAAVAVGWAATGRGLPPWLKTGVWVVGVTAIAGRILERPEIVTLFALSCWLFVLGTCAEHPWRFWLLPPLQVLWVNFHALSVLGLGVGCLFVLDRLYQRAMHAGAATNPYRPLLPWKSSAIIVSLVAAAGFASPYGVQGASFPLVLLRKLTTEREFFAPRIAEFQSPLMYLERNGVDTIYLPAAAVLLVVTVATFVAVYARREFNLFPLTLFLAFTIPALSAIRNVTLWALVSTVVACWNLRDLLTRPADAPAISPRRVLPRVAFGGNVASMATLVLLSFSVIGGWWGAHPGAAWGAVFRLGLDEAYYSFDAIRFAGKVGLPNRAFLTSFGLAAVYEFEHGPEAKVFMDPRLEVNTQATFERFEWARSLMARGDTRWHAIVRDEQGNLPVLVIDARYFLSIIPGVLRDRRWRMIFADNTAAILAPAEVAERGGFPPAETRGLWWHDRLPLNLRGAGPPG